MSKRKSRGIDAGEPSVSEHHGYVVSTENEGCALCGQVSQAEVHRVKKPKRPRITDPATPLLKPHKYEGSVHHRGCHWCGQLFGARVHRVAKPKPVRRRARPFNALTATDARLVEEYERRKAIGYPTTTSSLPFRLLRRRLFIRGLINGCGAYTSHGASFLEKLRDRPAPSNPGQLRHDVAPDTHAPAPSAAALQATLDALRDRALTPGPFVVAERAQDLDAPASIVSERGVALAMSPRFAGDQFLKADAPLIAFLLTHVHRLTIK